MVQFLQKTQIGGVFIKKELRIALSRLLAAVLLLSAMLVFPPDWAWAAPTAEPIADIQDGVTLHCWNWSFQEITDNMQIIAALGYTAVQTSPVQQAKQATKTSIFDDWWIFYQPISFQIDDSGHSALGTRAEFEEMCETAHSYGIKVIVDVVANHMGNHTGGNTLAPGILADLKDDSDCWHDISKNIGNYSSRYEVTQYCMSDLPDLNTANKKVQGYVLEFLKACIDAGADGFRFDAAKHIETPEDGQIASDFWPVVVDGAAAYAKDSRGIELYCYGELLDSPGGSLGVDAYTQYMSITDNSQSAAILYNVVKAGDASAFSYGYHKDSAASNLVIWAESHDTFADGSTGSMNTAIINKAWALQAARANAMGLYLARPTSMSQLLGTASHGAWAYAEVAAVNHFHNRFAGQGEYVSNENGIACVERGNAGAVLVNCRGNGTQVNVAVHEMADGTYTDQITGNTFTVAGGRISGTMGETGIAVVYEAEVCDHAAHSTAGFCSRCRVLVGHSYDEAGICSCGMGISDKRTLYFGSTAGWNRVNFYSWYPTGEAITSAWPGDAMEQVSEGIYSCTVPADAPNIIFNNGSKQTADLVIPDLDSGKNFYDYGTGKWSVYDPQGEPPVPDPGPDDPAEPKPSEPAQNSGGLFGWLFAWLAELWEKLMAIFR